MKMDFPSIPIPPGLETECFILSPDALAAVPAVLTRHWGKDLPVWLVADENTWQAAGGKLSGLLKEAGCVQLKPYLFPRAPVPHASEELIQQLLAVFPADCLPVAVGSGTINDLVKRAAFLRNIRYCCVPTAASVDGYTAYGAAITVDGFKQTLPCPAPLAVVADSRILEKAPPAMLAAGYADLAAKIPAGADWLLAAQLGESSIRPDVWELVQPALRDNLSDPQDVEKVFMGLAATGYAMQLYRDSRPASGAEHLMSHVWEMENLEFHGEAVSHGFKVAIGTLAATALYEELFSLSVEEARSLAAPGLSRAEREQEIAELLRRGCYGVSARTTALDKFLSSDRLTARRESIYRDWEKLKKVTLAQLYPFSELQEKFRQAGCPASPVEIGLSPEQFQHGILTAQLIRNRYTILDLAYELGLLYPLVSRLPF